MYSCTCVNPRSVNTTYGFAPTEEHLLSELHCDNVDFGEYGVSGIPSDLPFVRSAFFTRMTFEEMPQMPQNFAQLQFLYFRQNVIGKFPAKRFQNLESLSHLYIENNQVTNGAKLQAGVFFGLESVTVMNISNNTGWLGVRSGVFSQQSLPKVLEIVLCNNGLFDIEDDAFQNATSLSTLLLAQNQLTIVPRLSSAPLRRLHHLDLSYNRLQNLHNLYHMPNLKTLLLHHNALTVIAADAFKHVKTRLTFLDLSYNQLATVAPTAFMSLLNLTELDLDNNRLRRVLWEELPWNDSVRHGKLARITLYSNPWHCDCRNEFLAEGNRVIDA